MIFIKRFIIAIVLVLIIFAFPQSVGSGELDMLKVFFYEISEDGHDVMNYYNIIIPVWLSVEQRAIIVFTEIFDNFNPDEMIYAPPNVQVLDVVFDAENAHLIVNLSLDILNYGGTYFEHLLITKLMTNAANITNVNYFTILINSEPRYFPEGTTILKNSLAFFN
ncbi:MAG: GerMN domain-containing protein [Defluviitaleaceae bacterium]|nr:GerMN domain-containing protein [Defluviitaleaceae bacterium]